MQKKQILYCAQSIDINLKFLQEHVWKIFSHGSTKPSNWDLIKIEKALRESQNLAKMIADSCEGSQDPFDKIPAWGIDFQDEI